MDACAQVFARALGPAERKALPHAARWHATVTAQAGAAQKPHAGEDWPEMASADAKAADAKVRVRVRVRVRGCVCVCVVVCVCVCVCV